MRDQSGNRGGMNAAEMVNETAIISEMSVSTCWKINVRGILEGYDRCSRSCDFPLRRLKGPESAIV